MPLAWREVAAGLDPKAFTIPTWRGRACAGPIHGPASRRRRGRCRGRGRTADGYGHGRDRGVVDPGATRGRLPGRRQPPRAVRRRFPAVEINSSFYRPHRPSTYQRWAATVPAHFRFAVKVPKEITHLRRLADVRRAAGALPRRGRGARREARALAGATAAQLRLRCATRLRLPGASAGRTQGDVACEPRHRSWFTAEAERLLSGFRIARVAADPAVVPAAAEPGGWPGLAYYRLHGSPRMYRSPYALGRSRMSWGSGFRAPRRRLVHLRQHGGRLGDARRTAAFACVGARATGPSNRAGSAGVGQGRPADWTRKVVRGFDAPCAASAAYNTVNVQRHLISRRTLRAFRAEAAAQWHAAAAAQGGFGRGELSRFLGSRDGASGSCGGVPQ